MAKILELHSVFGEMTLKLDAKIGAIDSVEKSHRGDPDLFKPPPKPTCEICFLPFPPVVGVEYLSCCGKLVCAACVFESQKHLIVEGVKKERSCRMDPRYKPKEMLDVLCCPFCRQPIGTESDGEFIKRLEKRVDKNDELATYMLARTYRDGAHGLQIDTTKYVKLVKRAADLGSMEACFDLAGLYCRGDCGVARDLIKMGQYDKTAAKLGEVRARYSLGATALIAGDIPLAHRHWMMSVACGHNDSLDRFKTEMMEGRITEQKYSEIKSIHKGGEEEMESTERDRASRSGYDFKRYMDLWRDEVLESTNAKSLADVLF